MARTPRNECGTMKTKRHKHVTKVLTFYKNNFGYNAPYHVLVDGTFCKSALKFKVNIAEQLPKYLEAEVKLYTTKCVTAECEVLGEMSDRQKTAANITPISSSV